MKAQCTCFTDVQYRKIYEMCYVLCLIWTENGVDHTVGVCACKWRRHKQHCLQNIFFFSLLHSGTLQKYTTGHCFLSKEYLGWEKHAYINEGLHTHTQTASVLMMCIEHNINIFFLKWGHLHLTSAVHTLSRMDDCSRCTAVLKLLWWLLDLRMFWPRCKKYFRCWHSTNGADRSCSLPRRAASVNTYISYTVVTALLWW